MTGSKPVRFLILILIGWGMGRIVAYRLVTAETPVALADLPLARHPHRSVPIPVLVADTERHTTAHADGSRWEARSHILPRHRDHDKGSIPSRTEIADAHSAVEPGFTPPAATPGADAAPGFLPVTFTAPGSPASRLDRWSGFAYLFHRPGGGYDPLAPIGQLGGSQMAARIAWRIAPAAPVALALRASAALARPHQAELAPAIDILPSAVVPIRFTVERRIAIGGRGRDAWSAFAAGGLARALARHIDLDGYVQAGIVGARRRDGFVDGAIRMAHRTAVGPATDLRIGAGLWGAAQPHVARLDIGPRAALSARLPLPITIAIEGRARIAGAARPGTGIALIVATDF